MLTLRGRYVGNKAELVEDVPFDEECDVLVTFLTGDDSIVLLPQNKYRDSVRFILLQHLGLSPRELEVLRLLHDGLTNHDIAERLKLGDGTIRNYTSSIYRKMGVRNRTEAVRFAIDQDLLGS